MQVQPPAAPGQQISTAGRSNVAERLLDARDNGRQVQEPLTKASFPHASAWSPTVSACHG
jgi:hypothetical protein